MKLKVFLLFLLTIFCQKSFTEIGTLYFLEREKQQILILGDTHKGVTHYDILRSWLQKLGKTYFIYEARKEYFDYLKQMMGSWDTSLLTRITYLHKEGKINKNIKFTAADIRPTSDAWYILLKTKEKFKICR